MAMIMSVATWRPNAGRQQDFLAAVTAAKAIHTRLGGEVRVGLTQFGGAPSTIVYALRFADWAAFGAFSTRLETDEEWQTLWSRAGADPSAQLISHVVSSEVAL
jgi:hypothetical protein